MQKRLFSTYFILIIFTLIVSIYSIWHKSHDYLINQTRELYAIQGELLASFFQEDEDQDIDEYIEVINNYSKMMNTRITVIDDDGVVIIDTYEDVTNMDNHLDRVEVKKALNGELWSEIRFSETMGMRYCYTAVPFEVGTFSGVMRLSTPLNDIEWLTKDMIKSNIILLVVASIIATLLAIYFTRNFMKPIDELTVAAEEISNGNYDKKIYISQNDQIGQLASVFNNMTRELRLNMWKLTKRKTELEAMLSNMVNGVIAVNDNNKIMFSNNVALDLLGIRDEEEIYDKSVYDIVRCSTLFNVIEKTIDKDSHYVEEGKVKGGLCRIYGNPITAKNGKRLGIIIVIEDITRIRKLENMRKDFVSNVSHELKTPLTSISGFIDVLKNGAIEDEEVARRFLDIIDIESERLNLLIEDILTLSEIESKQLDKNMEFYSINTIIDEVVGLFERKISDKKIQLEFDMESDLPKYYCNKNRIKQLLINLLENAYKYTDEGAIRISCYKKRNEIIIGVKDSGIGIKEEHIPRLFERFYRVDQGRARKQGGTGLGLAIAKHIVELYNGSIEVKSEIDKGTEFIIKLPYIKKDVV